MTPMFLLRRTVLGAALGFSVGLSYYLPAIPVLMDVKAPLLDAARSMVVTETASVMLLAFLLTLSSRWAHGPAARVAAAVLAILVTIAIRRMAIFPFTGVGWWEMQGGESARSAVLWGIWHVITSGVLLAVYFDYVRRVQASAGRLRQAQVDRQRVERDMLEARLDMIRARVDPVHLFESLARVRAAYARDAAEAERLLDELIFFLRSRVDRPKEAA